LWQARRGPILRAVTRTLTVCLGPPDDAGRLARSPVLGARRVLIFGRAGTGVRRGLAFVAARLAERADVDVVLAPAPPTVERAALAVHENVSMRDLLARDDLVAEVAASHLVVTASGPVEEMASAFAVPVLVMRGTPDRADPVRVLQAAERLLDDEELHRRTANAPAWEQPRLLAA
jgi:hypothetical protein